ncbi:flagellar filament capping protein FliD [Paenibacillus sp. SGZ-1009]|uniref:flagellar filament capping protein FliD n=1 Tax=Paenibacillus campi TaxID=3106031 RepID=UPI002AFE376B|nr:flagellar filament capping protein FliD [Paenibacillus sp. SGZ-1009]
MDVTRISGLASGMDIDSIVKKLMTAEKIPLDKLNQQRQLVSWKQESYRDVSSQMVTFLNDKLANLSLSSSINAQKANVTGDTSSVSASANGAANGASMNVTVSQLATATRVSSSSGVSANDSDGGKDGSKLKMSDVTGNSNNGSVSIKLGSGTAVSIAYNATDTINDFVQKINTSQAGVTAIYDSSSGKMSITSNSTGNSKITLSGDSNGNAFDGFNIASSTDSDSANSVLGKNAKVNINGLDMTQSTNQFVINGVQLTLNAVSPSGQSSQVSVVGDTDKLVSSVQSFVDAYNSVLSLMNNKVGEERYAKFPPLTEDQKKTMTDDQIKLWETKAKSGMLKDDGILEQTISSMRTAMVQGVKLDNGTTISFAQLGISTGTYETKGKLILDTDKLKAALDNDPNIVTNFFGNNNSSSALNNTYTENDGILARMKKITRTSLESMASTAGTSKVSSDANASFLLNSLLGTQLSSLDRQITDMTSRLNDKETNYYQKFTAMETAMNKYNSQASALSSFR